MSRDLETLRNLFAFGRWANRTIIESVAVLTPEEYARPIGGSFGSVQGTLVHLYGADWVWLERFHGHSPRALPAADELAALEALARKWRELEAGQDAFIATPISVWGQSLLILLLRRGRRQSRSKTPPCGSAPGTRSGRGWRRPLPSSTNRNGKRCSRPARSSSAWWRVTGHEGRRSL